jgi:hypothetical protein
VQLKQLDAFACNTSAIPKQYDSVLYDLRLLPLLGPDAYAFPCQHYTFDMKFSLNASSADCPLLPKLADTYGTELLCLTLRTCTGYPRRAPFMLFLVWIVLLVVGWVLTEPLLCAGFLACFKPIHINRHHAVYRQRHFILILMGLDAPVAVLAGISLIDREGHWSSRLIVITAILLLTLLANAIAVCNQMRADAVERKREEALEANERESAANEEHASA